jgi:hypothetical protein
MLDLRRRMLVRVLLLGEREESPGEFPNRTANGPTRRVLPSAQVEVILCTCFEQLKQLVFRMGNLLVAGEVVMPTTCVSFAEILRVDDDQGVRIRAQRASRGEHPFSKGGA